MRSPARPFELPSLVNHSSPLGPVAICSPYLPPAANVDRCPDVVILPTRPLRLSVNQRSLSSPAAMPCGCTNWLLWKLETAPPTVIRPIEGEPTRCSQSEFVNHIAPS